MTTLLCLTSLIGMQNDLLNLLLKTCVVILLKLISMSDIFDGVALKRWFMKSTSISQKVKYKEKL